MTAGRLWRDPVFKAGLLLRALLIVLLVPEIQQAWFVPFLIHAVTHPSADPWTAFLATGGDPLSYPYGPVMLLVHLPGMLLGWLADRLLHLDYLAGVGFRCSLVAADTATLHLLYRLLPGQPRKLLWLYWWSPISLYVTYWNGQTDIVPVALLLMALLLIKSYRARGSGAALGVAIAAKLSMVLAAPFMGIYLWRNKRLRHLLWPFGLGFGLSLLLLQGPWLLSPGYRSMVFGTREGVRVLDLALALGPELRLYVTPTLYLLAAYLIWRLRRISFDLLIATTGLSFFLIVLATPAPVGWYLWLVPFMVAHQLQADRSTMVLTGGFSALLIVLHGFVSTGVKVPLLGLDPATALSQVGALITPRVHSIWITLILSAGLVILVQMLRERVGRNDYYRIGQKPVTLGIAGDSGSGKDTLCRALAGIFGEHSVVQASGDDYHVWDRYAPMWQGLTHLNPRANDLQRFNNDVLALMDGKPIVCRRYDHAAGRFLSPTLLNKNDVIIASGLHTLLVQRLRERFDVTVFLDIDEELRRFWKIHRDVHQRGHNLDEVIRSLDRRAADAQRYILPQKAVASLVLRLMPVNARQLQAAGSPEAVRLKLVALIRNGMYYERLARILIGICGLHLDVQLSDESGEVEMIIEGDVAAEDISLAARTLVPALQEMLDIQPIWQDGMTGVMQLLVLIQVEESLKDRIK